GEKFEALCNKFQAGGDSVNSCEMEVAGVTHAELSGAILGRWKLPAPIRTAAAYHHLPDQADGGNLHLAHVIEAVDHYINSAGLGMPPYRYCHASSFDDSSKPFG